MILVCTERSLRKSRNLSFAFGESLQVCPLFDHSIDTHFYIWLLKLYTFEYDLKYCQRKVITCLRKCTELQPICQYTDMYYKHLVFNILFLLPVIIQIFLCIQCLLIVCYLIGIGIAKVLSDGAHSLLGQFTDLTFSREENKNKVIRCGFFNLSNGIFWVFYEKFD